MRVCLTKFTDEIADFLTNETLKAIDYLLTVELELNYLENETGIFRVCRRGNFWYYKQGKHIIKAICLDELKKQVTVENRIWYVFDEDLAKKYGGIIF